MSNPLVSILMPVYNVERFVESALKSLINQTYENIEIIVVDDCSTDNTFIICKKISEIDPRVKLFRNSKNLKIVKTLNFALQQASGNYIARMDGDDLSTNMRIENLVTFIRSNPQYSLVGSNMITIDENGKKIGIERMPTSQNLISKTIMLSSPVAHNWLATRDTYDLLNGYRDIPGVEDYDFLLRMDTHNLLFTNVDSFDYCVRIRNGNTTSTIGFVQRLMTNYILDLYKLRKNKIDDNFSIEDMNNYIKANEKYKKYFEKSNDFLLKAIHSRSKNKLKMILYLLFSCVTSKYQFQYLIKRFTLKVIKKIY